MSVGEKVRCFMEDIFVDGRFCSREEGVVSASDAGLLHGVGLFETMLGGVRDAKPWCFGLKEHMDRIEGSCRELGLSMDVAVEGLKEAVLTTIERSGYERTRVRLTLTGGDLNLLRAGSEGDDRSHQLTVIIDAQPAMEYPEAMFERGVTVTVCDAKANPFEVTAGHKTLNYWWRLTELRKAAAKRAGESLVFSITNHLAGGCVSNAFVVREGALWTPIARGDEKADKGSVVLPSAVLPGVTRGMILELAKAQGFEVCVRMITIDDVMDGEEVFLTNSSWGVLPVVGVEAGQIGDGKPGKIAKLMREKLCERISECGGG